MGRIRRGYEAQLRQARIVYEPCHAFSHANGSTAAGCRVEHRQRKRTGDDSLKGRRQLWLYGRERLDCTRRRVLKTLLLAPELKVGLARALKEQLFTLWVYNHPSAARAFLDGWKVRAPASGRPSLQRVARMTSSHLKHILVKFWHPISNGYAEGFNSVI